MRFILLFLALISFTAHADLCSEVKQVLEPGDVLFIGVKTDPLGVYKQIAKVNNTWVNHVGIAFFEDGEWRVNESTIPWAKAGRLCAFLKRAKPGKLAVKRLRERLHAGDADLLLNEARKRMGKAYDLGFNLDHPKKQYCSKFVYEVFRDALRIQVGKVETIRDLVNETKDSEEMLRFWKRWYFGKIPWERRIVTPYSQYVDPQLETVLDYSQP